jgi:hypothetical protein
MGEVEVFQSDDGLFFLKNAPVEIVQTLASGLDAAIDLSIGDINEFAEACIQGIIAGSGLGKLTPDAVKLLDEIRDAAKAADSESQKARTVCNICLKVYSSEELFGSLYNTVNEKLRSIRRIEGAD